jgi:hypothetical protein
LQFELTEIHGVLPHAHFFALEDMDREGAAKAPFSQS